MVPRLSSLKRNCGNFYTQAILVYFQGRQKDGEIPGDTGRRIRRLRPMLGGRVLGNDNNL